MADAVRRLWRGEVPLPIAFWHYACFGGLVVNLATTGAALALLAAGAPAALALAILALHLPYSLFMALAVWRSADNYGGARRWVDLARAAIVAWTILMAVT